VSSVRDTYASIVAQIAEGREVAVLDTLAHAAERERASLQQAVGAYISAGVPSAESTQALLAFQDDPEFLGACFALATHGHGRAADALAIAMTHVATAAVGDGSGYVAHISGGTPLVGRLIWGLTAQALVVNNRWTVAVATRAHLPRDRSDRGLQPMSADTRLRYSAPLREDASMTVAHYREWLLGREWISDVSPYLDLDRETSLREADFCLGLAAAHDAPRNLWVEGFGRAEVMEHVAARVETSPATLASLLGVEAVDLRATVLERAERLQGSRDWFDERTLLKRYLGGE